MNILVIGTGTDDVATIHEEAKNFLEKLGIETIVLASLKPSINSTNLQSERKSWGNNPCYLLRYSL